MGEEKESVEDRIHRVHQAEDWIRITSTKRTNHYQAELMIHGQKSRIEKELGDDS